MRSSTSRFSEMLRIYLAAYRLSQQQVALEMGISDSTLSRFLAGKAMPDAHSFMRIVVWSTLPPVWKDSSDKMTPPDRDQDAIPSLDALQKASNA